MRFNRVHAVCTYLRIDKDNPQCKLCPRSHATLYGRGRLGCYALAQEAINIAIHGHPFIGETPSRTQLKQWRARFNDRSPPTRRP